MKKLLQFLLLAFGLLLFRYLISVTVAYVFPTYVVTESATIINDSPQISGDKPIFSISELWNKHQAIHYIDIALNGYSIANAPFSPLYPLILKIVLKMFPIFDGISSVYAVATILSTIFFGLALFYLYKLLDLVWLYDDKKHLVFLVLLTFPTSFYFNLAYADALFLFLSVLGFYHLFNKHYFLAFLFVALMSLTKLGGLVALISFIFYFYISERYNKRVNKVTNIVLYTAMTVFPLLVHYYVLSVKVGSFFAALQPQHSTFIPFGYFFSYIQSYGLSFRPELFFNFFFMLALLAFLIYAFVQMFLVWEGRSHEQSTLFIYLVVMYLAVSTYTAQVSIFEYFTACLPAFLAFSMTTNLDVKRPKFLSIVFILLSLQILFFVFFVVGIPSYIS